MPASVVIGWPPLFRSMMARRRWARPAIMLGCSQNPSPSGPRCDSSPDMVLRESARPANGSEEMEKTPAMPHMDAFSQNQSASFRRHKRVWLWERTERVFASGADASPSPAARSRTRSCMFHGRRAAELFRAGSSCPDSLTSRADNQHSRPFTLFFYPSCAASQAFLAKPVQSALLCWLLRSRR